MQRGIRQVCFLFKQLNNSSTFRSSHLKNRLHKERTPICQSRNFCRSAISMSYVAEERGSPNSFDYRIFYTGPTGYISPFHDIPLNSAENVFNMVVEIPRWTNSKMEISKDDPLNPIKQDIKKGALRFVKNVFPHHGYIWNYGAMPQTWEDPNHTEPDTGTKGDQDPLDVCEIGSKIHRRGAVIQVKVLAVMCLIDEGETDWKIMAIDVTDPLAEKINDVEDIEREMPGFLKATNEWFRIYKIPDGKPENEFAFNGEVKNREYALRVIKECNEQWQMLISKQCEPGDISCVNTGVAGPYMITAEDAKVIVDKTPAKGESASIPGDVNKWHYVKIGPKD